MNREEFISQLSISDKNINKDQIINILNKSIDSNLKDGNKRGHKNLIIVMEELAELTQAISKNLRGKEDFINLLEELADVYLGILYVQQICDINDEMLNKAINVKAKRLETVLNKTGKYN